MTTTELKVLLHQAVLAAMAGGEEILKVYIEPDVQIEQKFDKSPLTLADRNAHRAIEDILRESGIPVLSEEGKEIPYSDRRHWQQLWIVDPLDGTKEFIKKNGEFTVNIALCVEQVPLLGVIYVPVEDCLYFSAEGVGAYRLSRARENYRDLESAMSQAMALPQKQEREFTMVGSRSHMSPETAEYFESIREEYPSAQVLSRGSSLKLCMVAEGSADVYPRFAPTMEWDTAAGHAIAREAGFEVYEPDSQRPLQYNKEELLNPWFIVKAKA